MPEAPVGNGPLFGQSLRTPPTNIQAEQALLGAIMSNGKALHAVAEFLKAEHFADPLHGRIYREAERRIYAGGVADAIALRSWFTADPDCETAGGVGYLSLLLTAMVGIINAREYGRAVYDCWQRRALIEAGEHLVNSAFNAASETPAEIGQRTIDQLDNTLAGATVERAAMSLDDAMQAAMQSARDAQVRGGPVGLSTGMPTVDRALGGLRPQTLTVIAARPGMGKSSLARVWAVEIARTARDARLRGEAAGGVLLISLEMSAEEQGQCTLSGLSGVPLEAIIRGELDQPDWDRLVLAQNERAGLPLTIEDANGLDIGMIRLRARRARRKHGLGMIIIDHMHIVRTDTADTKNGATWAVSKVSNALKGMAKEFGCPVIALAQLNRGVESRDEKRPTLRDLQQSGAIEQDADAVGFIYREEYYLPKGEPERTRGEPHDKFQDRCEELARDRLRLKGRAELIFEKVRMGRPQTINLHFEASTVSFREVHDNG